MLAEIVGKECELAAAANFRELRRRGVTVRKTIDVMAEHLGLRVVPS